MQTLYCLIFSFCILQKPTSEAIVTAAKIFRKESLTDYHRSLNEEAARLAENDPSLLTIGANYCRKLERHC